MGEAIAHRGPDDHGEIVLESTEWKVGLAHRRLSIIDLSPEGHQPMTVQCMECYGRGTGRPSAASLWLTYNGEIYNYRELRGQLEAKGHRFHSQTDSEILLHLYVEKGVEMLEALNGIFAFALYDGRPIGQRDGTQAGDLFLARDGLGVKPLYYAQTTRGFLFASELKALLQCQDVPTDLDYEALHHYLAYLWAPAPRTMLKEVRKLPPGQALLVRRGQVARQWTYYDLPYGRMPISDPEAEIVAQVRDRLETAVAAQMVADVPVGAFLSGGLDSSLVVAMMRRVRPEFRPTCYSIGFVGEEDLEGSPADLPYARRVAKYLNVNLHVIEVKPDIIENLERMLYYLDEPQADPAPINALLIAEQARRDGIKVLLSGVGGDDIFSGYRRHTALTLEQLWRWVPRVVRAAIARQAAKSNSQHPWGRRVAKMLGQADLSPEDRLVAYFYWSGERTRSALYSPELSARLADVDTAEPLRQSLRRIPGDLDPLSKMLYLETKHFLADHNLNYTDKMSMAAGVEVRVPLLDQPLVDLAARIPSHFKQRGRTGKAILKKAAEPFLPWDVVYRPKSGFGAPLRRWVRDELRDVVDDVLSPRVVKHRGLFDPGAVQRLVAQNRTRRVDGAYTILSLMCIELWCRIFVDRRARRSIA